MENLNNNETIINAYVVNLGNYMGRWMSLPMDEDQLQNEIKSLGNVGGDYDVHDYETDFTGIYPELSKMSVHSMNDLANKLQEMDEYEQKTFEILVESIGNIEEAFERMESQNFIMLMDIENEEDLGRAFVEDLGGLEVPSHLENYVDYEAIGRDLSFSGWSIVGGAAVCLD